MAKTKTNPKKVPAKTQKTALSHEAEYLWEEITKRVKRALIDRKLSQGKFAEKAGLHRPFLSRILNEPTNLTLETIGQLMRVLRTELIVFPDLKKEGVVSGGGGGILESTPRPNQS